MNQTIHKCILAIFTILIALAIGFFPSGCGRETVANEELSAELQTIDALIKRKGEISRLQQHRLDSLSHRAEKATGTAKVERIMDLADEYRLFNADSSLYYCSEAVHLAERLGNPQLIAMAHACRVATLAALGLFSEGASELQQVKECEPKSQKLKERYYYAGRTLYGYLVGYLNDNSEYLKTARSLYRQYDDSLISVLPDTDPLKDFLIGEKYSSEGDYASALRTEMHLMQHLNPDSRLYAMTAVQVAMVYRSQGESEKMATYLAKGAIADLRTGVRDGLALPMLASYLYKIGDVDQAFRYVNVSLQEAASGGIRWRASLISQIVPNIDAAYHDKMTGFQNKLVVYAGIITFIMIGAAVLLYLVYRQHKKLQRQALLLGQKAKLQTSYIGNFVAMCASYADRLNHLTGVVDRKLAAGEVESLKKMLKSGKFMETEDEDFYRIFDTAFLDIYPDFVKGLNDLLREEERLSWKKGSPLSPELRIYALVRLGVNESTRIAQILHYSVSTVYAYRNRMRNRAINRDEFEKEVLKISTQQIPTG